MGKRKFERVTDKHTLDEMGRMVETINKGVNNIDSTLSMSIRYTWSPNFLREIFGRDLCPVA